MPVQKPAAEPAGNAPGPGVPAQLGNELADLQKLVLAQNQQIEELRALVNENSDRLPPKKKVKPPAELPEGTKRYWSVFAEPLFIRQAGRRIMINGSLVNEPMIGADFSGHVFETSDPEMIEWLDNHPEYGSSFWQDATAKKRHSDVQVVEGVRTTEPPVRPPRAPLAAPMQ